jgi:hypothetical protein
MHIKSKLISTAAFVAGLWLIAAPAYATCGVNGYWGSECGPQTPSNPGNTTNTLTGGNNTATGGTATGVGTGIGVGTGGAGGSSTATATGHGGQGGQGGGGGAGGSATATGGSISGSGNSSSDSSAVAGVTGSGNSSSRSGVTGSGNSRNSNNVSVSNSTRIKHAANTAAPVMMGGYGPANCFGDTNPSGQFGASIQTFGWGVTANRSKASNVCAAYAIAGPQGAIGYLAQQDPQFRAIALANGWAVTKSQAAQQAANASASQPAARQRITCPSDHPHLREVRGELRCYR